MQALQNNMEPQQGSGYCYQGLIFLFSSAAIIMKSGVPAPSQMKGSYIPNKRNVLVDKTVCIAAIPLSC